MNKLKEIEFDRNKKVFTGIISYAQEQVKRYNGLFELLEKITDQIFEKNSLTYNKYINSASTIEKAIIKNDMQAKMLIDNFNNKEYLQLQDFDEDSDVEPYIFQRLELYENNIESVKKKIESNEELLLKLEELITELLDKKAKEDDSNIAIENVNELIEQLKYYK